MPVQRKGTPGRAGGVQDDDAGRNKALVEPSDRDIELETVTRHLRETQRLLEESRDRYADLFDYAPLGYVTLDRKGFIRETNITFAEMIGYNQRFLIETPFSMYLAGSQIQPFMDHLVACGKNSEKVTTELRLKHKNGEELDVELSSAPMADYRSRSTLYRTAVIDITERKRAQHALQQAKDELEIRVQERSAELAGTFEELQRQVEDRLHAMEELRTNEKLLLHQNRLASMGEMIGNIAHQWRQPLNTLALMIQSLPLEYEMGNFTAEYLQESAASAMKVINHMSQTINDFREFFKSDKALVAFDVKASVMTTMSIIEAGLKEQHVSLDLRMTDEKVRATGYPNEYAQVLLNILMNAGDVFRERGMDKPEIVLKVFREKGQAVVTIEDNAGGIPNEILDRIFDPYFTTKGPEKGTGIGLFMSKMIVEKNMHGRLTVRNTDKGAEFRVELAEQEGENTGEGSGQ